MAPAIADPVATTVQVTEQTLASLKRAKEELGAATYDELIQKLLMDHRKRTLAIRGLTKGLAPFERDHAPHRD